MASNGSRSKVCAMNRPAVNDGTSKCSPAQKKHGRDELPRTFKTPTLHDCIEFWSKHPGELVDLNNTSGRRVEVERRSDDSAEVVKLERSKSQ